MKALVILKPRADNGDRQAILDVVRRQFAAAAAEYEVHDTREGERVANIVRRRVREGCRT